MPPSAPPAPRLLSPSQSLSPSRSLIPSCHCRYGLLLDRHGHQDSAQQMFEAVLSLDAAHADTLCAYGDLLSRVKVLHPAPFPSCSLCLSFLSRSSSAPPTYSLSSCTSTVDTDNPGRRCGGGAPLSARPSSRCQARGRLVQLRTAALANSGSPIRGRGILEAGQCWSRDLASFLCSFSALQMPA